jgi:hypothetical protein
MKSPCGVELERKSFAGERQIEDDAIIRVRSRHDLVERLSEVKNGGVGLRSWERGRATAARLRGGMAVL